MIIDLLRSIKTYKVDILMLERDREKVCEPFNVKIKELIENIAQAKTFLEAELKVSGEKKIETKLGNAAFKKQQDKWTYIKKEIMGWIRMHNPEDTKKWYERYIKVEETLKKQVLKDDVVEGNKIPGVTHEPQEDKFMYTIKGGII